MENLCSLKLNSHSAHAQHLRQVNFGEGVLEIQTYELANLPVVEPRLLQDFEWSISSQKIGKCCPLPPGEG